MTPIRKILKRSGHKKKKAIKSYMTTCEEMELEIVHWLNFFLVLHRCLSAFPLFRKLLWRPRRSWNLESPAHLTEFQKFILKFNRSLLALSGAELSNSSLLSLLLRTTEQISNRITFIMAIIIVVVVLKRISWNVSSSLFDFVYFFLVVLFFSTPWDW